jgi:predicted XRE-type DNA-binding protein
MTKRQFVKKSGNSTGSGMRSSPRAQVANMKARSETMIAIREAVSKWRPTQAAMAKRLGLTQPRLNDLLHGRINKFSLDALINIAMAAGLEVRVKVRAA